MRTAALILAVSALMPAVASTARADIVVGFVTGLSGPVSSIGIPNAKGIAAGVMFQDEIGGEKIRLIQLDDASDPTAAARDARKLVEQDKVDFLIGTSGAPQTFAMATTAVELKTAHDRRLADHAAAGRRGRALGGPDPAAAIPAHQGPWSRK